MSKQPHEVLEERLAGWVGEPWADPAQWVACSSGTAALHLALESLRLPPNSRVLVPDFTMVAVPRAVVMAGLEPLFVDCGPDLNLDPGTIRDCYGSNARAIVAVHTYGRQCDMEAIHRRASAAGLYVVEDMAELHGVAPHPRTDAATWSFYRNKVVAGEEGGAVAFQIRSHSRLARELRCLGFTAEHDFMHVPRGHNYRLAPSLAEAVLGSLKYYHAHVQIRRQGEALYEAKCPEGWKLPYRQSPWVYDLRVTGLNRKKQGEIVRVLNSQGIEARMSFAPMTWQQEWREGHSTTIASLADRASNEVFYLPLAPGEVTEESADRAFRVIHGVLG